MNALRRSSTASTQGDNGSEADQQMWKCARGTHLAPIQRISFRTIPKRSQAAISFRLTTSGTCRSTICRSIPIRQPISQPLVPIPYFIPPFIRVSMGPLEGSCVVFSYRSPFYPFYFVLRVRPSLQMEMLPSTSGLTTPSSSTGSRCGTESSCSPWPMSRMTPPWDEPTRSCWHGRPTALVPTGSIVIRSRFSCLKKWPARDTSSSCRTFAGASCPRGSSSTCVLTGTPRPVPMTSTRAPTPMTRSSGWCRT